MTQQWCKHANLIQNPKESTWQWCRDCGAFRERPQAVWNEPSRPRELRTKLAALLAALLKAEDGPADPEPEASPGTQLRAEWKARVSRIERAIDSLEATFADERAQIMQQWSPP